jgi:hypothetical protein
MSIMITKMGQAHTPLKLFDFTRLNMFRHFVVLAKLPAARGWSGKNLVPTPHSLGKFIGPTYSGAYRNCDIYTSIYPFASFK